MPIPLVKTTRCDSCFTAEQVVSNQNVAFSTGVSAIHSKVLAMVTMSAQLTSAMRASAQRHPPAERMVSHVISTMRTRAALETARQ